MKQISDKIQNSRPVSIILTIWALCGFPLLCQLFTEWVRIGEWHETVHAFVRQLPLALLGTVVLSLIMTGIYILTRRVWISTLVVGLLMLTGSFVSFYKITYRGDPLLPKDLLLAVDAAKISSGLGLKLTYQMGFFFFFVALSVCVLLPVRSVFAKKGWKAFGVRVLICLIPAALCGVYLKTVLWNKKVQTHFGVDTSQFYPVQSYQKAGFVSAFLMYFGALEPAVPEYYSPETVQAAAAALPVGEHSTQKRPDVVVIMLESYYHLDNLPGLVCDTDLTKNYDRYAKEGISGDYIPDKYSGGTESMEFGALTGFSTSFLPTGSIPYMEYVDGEFPCYPRFMKEQGYKTIALHSFDLSIYRRNEVYPAMGFDQVYGRDDFVSPTMHGNFIDDTETARKVISLYEDATADGSSVFMHTVTVQNHIPNQPGEYPEDYSVNVTMPGISDYSAQSLKSVATGLRDVDDAIGILLDYFSQSDRDVVVLIFGDHQTAIGDQEGKELLDELPEFTQLSDEEKELRTHHAPYLMWSNFETRNAETAGAMPPYQLLATMLKDYNVVRPAWFDWLADTTTTLKGVNLGRVIEPDGTVGGIVAGANEKQWKVLHQQKILQYNAMFGDGSAKQRMYQ